jgi:hypothetical protein
VTTTIGRHDPHRYRNPSAKPCGNPTTTTPIVYLDFDIRIFLITEEMDEPDNHIMQQTPPPSPYLETTWDLPLEQVHHGLLHPKEKRVGYLELYFTGFMEFVDEPPSPAMSDDETEYPRWGRIASTHDESRPSTARAEVPQSIGVSSFSDTAEPDIPMLSHRTGMTCISIAYQVTY